MSRTLVPALGTPRRRLTALVALVSIALVLTGAFTLTPSAHAEGNATISGTVTAADGGAPVEGELVSLVRLVLVDGQYELDDDYVDTASTAQDGTYAFSGVSAGTYTLRFWPAGLPYVSHYLGGVDDVVTATHITVTGDEAHPGQDQTLVEGGSIAGTITAGGAPAANIDVGVVAVPQDGEDLPGGLTTFASTDDDGHFVITGLEPGRYTVAAYTSDEYTTTYYGGTDDTDSATNFVLGDLQHKTGVDIALLQGVPDEPEGTGSVSGTVTDLDLDPIPGAAATLVAVEEDVDGNIDDTTDVADTTADANGDYTFQNIAAGHYTVRFSAAGYRTGYYPDAIALEDSFRFDLGDGQQKTNVGGLLGPGASISGTVTGTGGAPLEDSQVRAVKVTEVDGEIDDYDYVAESTTDGAGHYTLDGLAPGRYTVRADGPDDYLGQFYVAATTVAGSIRFDVAALQHKTGVDLQLGLGGSVSGTIRTSENAPIADARARIYLKTVDAGVTSWEELENLDTDASGAYSFTGLAPGSYVVKMSATGRSARYNGGALTRDSAPLITVTSGSATNAVDASLPLLVFPTPGIHGVDNQSYCTANTLPANDDDSTEAVTLPFAANYFGTTYTQTFINNNGNITFGEASNEFSPSDLTGPTARPIIAPFFSDVDTRGDGSAAVTYGSSPDHKVFCVNWLNVGSFSQHDEALNSFQLELIDRSSEPGGSAGDFDIVFNYDGIKWDTTDSTDGAPAVAGYSAGSGLAGTFLQLAGSSQAGAFLDGGPFALISGSRGSLTKLGRYVFPVRAANTPIGGTVSGTVTTGSPATPVVGAVVEVCTVGSVSCVLSPTNASGHYSAGGLAPGQHTVTVFPPDGSPLLEASTTVNVAAGVDTTVDLVMHGPTPIPAGTTITNIGLENGVPTVFWDDPLTLTRNGCAGGTASYQMVLDGAVVRSGAMTQITPGVYRALIAALAPLHGAATVTTTLTCPGGLPQPSTFDVYIDPSGTVTTTHGRPVSGATVTLYRSDTAGGTYTVVPDGDAIMSPGNRNNPSTTTASGDFGWDVVAGYYKVRASAPGCHAPGQPATSYVETGALPVPPAQLNLGLVLECSFSSTTAVTLSRTSAPYRGATTATLTVAGNGAVPTGSVVLRDGSTTVGTYALNAGRAVVALPKNLRVGTHSLRASYAGDGDVQASQSAAAVLRVTKLRSSVRASLAKRTITTKQNAQVRVTVKATGLVPGGTVTVKEGRKVLKARVLRNGTVVLTLPKLKKGTHRFVVYYGGSSTTATAKSSTLTLTVKKPKKK